MKHNLNFFSRLKLATILLFISTTALGACEFNSDSVDNYEFIKLKAKEKLAPFLFERSYWSGYLATEDELQDQEKLAQKIALYAVKEYCRSTVRAQIESENAIAPTVKDYALERLTEKLSKQLKDQRHHKAHDKAFIRLMADKTFGREIELEITHRKCIKRFFDDIHISRALHTIYENSYIEKPKPHIGQKGEIFELYPEFNTSTAEGSKRNNEFFSEKKFQKTKEYRQPECPVCENEFDGERSRVNLYCGHSMCPTCLANWVHVQDKPTCPSCRETIKKSEFALKYLKGHINCDQLKEYPAVSGHTLKECGCR